MKIKALYLFFLSIPLISGCNNNDDGKLKIVCSIFPQYEWVSELTKDVENVTVDLLIKNKIDLHSYQPSVEDIAKISRADLVIYNGGESDEVIEDALENKKNKDGKTVNLLSVLGDKAKEEEEKEGMEPEEEHEDEEETEYDEHVWNSLSNAYTFVESIKTSLIEIDESNKEKYEANANIYLNKISELKNSYEHAFDEATHKTLVVADRFPFRYLFDDYGLDYYAAFKGCSAESEASFETIIFLANKVDELGLNNIIKTSSNDGAIANAVKSNTSEKNQKTLSLDSLETKPENKTYLETMKANLDTLVEATK